MRIKAPGPSSSLAFLVIAVITAGLPGLLIWSKSAEGPVPFGIYAIATPFFLIALLLAIWGLRDLVRLLRYGRWQIECPDGGGAFGQPMPVTLLPARTFAPTGELTCRLRCARSYHIRRVGTTGNNLNTVTEWETTWSVRASTIHPRIGLTLTLPVPDQGLGSQRDPTTGAGVAWQLFVHIPAERLSEDVMFEIPIAPTTATISGAAGDIMQEIERRASSGAG
jgi:hypothetical protein